MDTTSTTTEILTAAEADGIAAQLVTLREAERRIGLASYSRTASLDAVRASARISEAIEAARNALQNVLTTAEVYGDCRNAATAGEERA